MMLVPATQVSLPRTTLNGCHFMPLDTDSW